MKSLYTAEQIANFFIDKSQNDPIQSGQLNPMKLQKLIYFAHGWCLAVFDHPLIDEAIQAWTYGPVVESLYHRLKQYSSQHVTQKLDTDAQTTMDDEILKLLNKVWESYKMYTGIQLSNLTHLDGTPWKQLHDSEMSKYGVLRKNLDIPDELIADFFKHRLDQATESH